MRAFWQAASLTAAFLLGSAIFASGAVQALLQSGIITPGHPAYWVQTGILGDGGVSTSGNINTLGITFNGGLPFCISNYKQPHARNQLCMGVSDGQAYLRLDAYDGASSIPLNVIIDGTSYPFPSPEVQTELRVVDSGSADIATSADTTILWNSSAAAAKTQTIYECTSGGKGNVLNIKDEYGSADVYPLTVVPGAGTIDNGDDITMFAPYQSVTLACDGVSNWVIL